MFVPDRGVMDRPLILGDNVPEDLCPPARRKKVLFNFDKTRGRGIFRTAAVCMIVSL